MTDRCPHCGKEIPKRPVGRPVGYRHTKAALVNAVAAVQSGKMTVAQAADHYGVSVSGIYKARKSLTE